jgi:sterol desaturase/sphingolipid hydroxylase (fatty acid hydroxylase superfamily)
MGDYNINGLAIPLFLVFMLLEFVWLKLQGKDLHRYNDTVTSLSMGLCLLISDALLKAYTFAVFIYLWEHHRLFDFGSQQIITWLLFFFAVDLCYYAFHRCAHEINILWGAHVGHHQSEGYNLTTALRQSAFQYAFSWVFYLPLAVLGCPPVVFLGLFVLLKMYQFWLHTQGISRIPLIEGIFSTPSSHRVHHAKNPIYIDRNYGGTLVIWDRFFGSWQPELASEPCHYGTTKPLDTLNPIKANFQHWSVLAKDSFNTQLWRDKVGLWFKPTGWRPEDCMANNHGKSFMQKDGCEDRPVFDPQASTLTKLYVGVSFLVIVLMAVMFLFLAPTLSAVSLALGTILLVYSLVVVNDLLEGNKRFAWLELVRVPLIVWFASTLWLTTSTTRNVDTLIMDKPPQEVLNYASNVALWPQWHPQSSKIYIEEAKPLLKGDKFEEDILTALGKNHLVWDVIERGENNWVAIANNQNNGSVISIEYRVKGIENNTKTEFTRILDYTLPNFFFVAVNALYLKSKVELKSQQGVKRLKKAVEAYVP